MLGGLRFRTLEDFSKKKKKTEEVECDWPLEQAEAWADVKANVVVKEVDALVSCDSWELWSATLVLPHLQIRWVRQQTVWSAFDGIG